MDATPEAGEGAPASDAVPPRRPKRPESVLVVVMTRGGEALMLRRTRPPGFWQSVTGGLRWNESALDAARRELTEETGLHPCDGTLIDLHWGERFPILPAWRARYGCGVHYNREHWFALVLTGRRLIRLNREEHLEHRWLPAGRAARLATSWTNRNAILLIGALLGV